MMDNIIRHIERAYGSLERPDWSFALKRVKAGLYENLIKKLADVGFVEETTDYNADNSRCISVTSEGQALTSRLSLVGELCLYSHG